MLACDSRSLTAAALAMCAAVATPDTTRFAQSSEEVNQSSTVLVSQWSNFPVTG